MIGRAAFARMTRRPILINTARGGLIVEEDLEAALDAGQLSGAGLDVTLPEPPAPDSAFIAAGEAAQTSSAPRLWPGPPPRRSRRWRTSSSTISRASSPAIR